MEHDHRAQRREQRRTRWQSRDAADPFTAREQSYPYGEHDAEDSFAHEVPDETSPLSRSDHVLFFPYASSAGIDGARLEPDAPPPLADEAGTDVSRPWEELVWGMLGVIGLAVGAVVLLAMLLAALAVFLLVDMRQASKEPATPRGPTSPLHEPARTPPQPPTTRSAHAVPAPSAPLETRPLPVLTSPEPTYVSTPTSARALVREIRTRLSERLEIHQQATRTPSPPTSPVTAGNTPARRVSTAAPFAKAFAQLGPLGDPEIAALAHDMSELGEVCRGLEQVAITHSMESQAKSARLQHLEERLERMSAFALSLHGLDAGTQPGADDAECGGASSSDYRSVHDLDGTQAGADDDDCGASLSDTRSLHSEFSATDESLEGCASARRRVARDELQAEDLAATRPTRWSSDYDEHVANFAKTPSPMRAQAEAGESQRDTDSSESDESSPCASPR